MAKASGVGGAYSKSPNGLSSYLPWLPACLLPAETRIDAGRIDAIVILSAQLQDVFLFLYGWVFDYGKRTLPD